MNRHNVFELHIEGEQLPVTDSLTYWLTITSKARAHCIRATAKGIATVREENKMRWRRSCCISLDSEDDDDGDAVPIDDEEEEVGGRGIS